MDEKCLVPTRGHSSLAMRGFTKYILWLCPMGSWTQVYILLVSRSSLHLFAIKSLKLPRVIETSTYKDLQHALRRILTWMPSTRFFSMLKKCLNLRFQPVIYLDLNYLNVDTFSNSTLSLVEVKRQ